MAGGGGGGFQGYRKSRNRLPETLRSYATRSWVSPGGTTLYNEVPPVSMELERKIVTGLMKDLNGLYDLGLGTDPILARKLGGGKQYAKPAILVIGGSNAGRTATNLRSVGMPSPASVRLDGSRQHSLCKPSFQRFLKL